MIIGFFLTPLTIHYLTKEKYGVWLTLLSMMTWFNFFDLGLGNGLKNKFAESIAQKNYKLARIYVSTSYGLLTIIVFFLLLITLPIGFILNWTKILNVSTLLYDETRILAVIVLTCFLLKFLLGLIYVLLSADQKTGLSSMIDFVSNVFIASSTIIIVYNSTDSLLLLGSTISIISLLIPLIATIILFCTLYKPFRPSLRLVEMQYLKELLSLGIKFFIPQLGAVILFSTTNIVITQLYGPSEVVVYNVANSYYSFITMGFSIIVAPFWPAYTEAYIKKDMTWIKRSINKLVKSWCFTAIIVIIMTIFANSFYDLWLKGAVKVPIYLSLAIGIYILMQNWCSIFVNFNCGIGKIKLQLIASTFITLITIPVQIILSSIFFIDSFTIIIANIILLFPFCFIWPIQVHKILSGSASGVWNN